MILLSKGGCYMETNKETIDALNTLLQGEYMGVESFNLFISKIEDNRLKERLKSIQDKHRENIKILSNYILDLGGKPDEKIASKIASDIWSHILSGCPSVTDSEVNSHFFICIPPYVK
jgi:bacterioferritin (cytochrome b1)